MEEKANRIKKKIGWLTNSGQVGARTTCGWGCVAASEVPSEPCSMTFRGRKRQRGQAVQKVTGRRKAGRYRGRVKKRIQECG